MPQQPRLFNPGPRDPDPWQHHPDKWMQQPEVVYHASYDEKLPRRDRGSGAQVDYGGSEGMHFGTKMAAYERAVQGASRDFIHTARLSAEQFRPKDMSPEQRSRMGFQSDPEAFTDDGANYSAIADRAVEDFKAVPYRNQYEDEGAISYRVRAEGVRTWAEDVRSQPNAHPALKHLAKLGYNPTFKTHKMVDYRGALETRLSRTPTQPHLWDAELVTRGRTRAVGSEDEMFAAMKKAPVGTGVKRLNTVTGDVGWGEQVKQAKPKLMRARTQAEVDSDIQKAVRRSKG